MTSAGTATAKPASGPAMPTSNNWRLRRIGWRIRMNAPSVPINVNGAGMKYGSDALTR